MKFTNPRIMFFSALFIVVAVVLFLNFHYRYCISLGPPYRDCEINLRTLAAVTTTYHKKTNHYPTSVHQLVNVAKSWGGGCDYTCPTSHLPYLLVMLPKLSHLPFPVGYQGNLKCPALMLADPTATHDGMHLAIIFDSDEGVFGPVELTESGFRPFLAASVPVQEELETKPQ